MRTLVCSSLGFGLLLLLARPSYAQFGTSGWSADDPVITLSGVAYIPLAQPAYPYIYLDTSVTQGASSMSAGVEANAQSFGSLSNVLAACDFTITRTYHWRQIFPGPPPSPAPTLKVNKSTASYAYWSLVNGGGVMGSAVIGDPSAAADTSKYPPATHPHGWTLYSPDPGVNVYVGSGGVVDFSGHVAANSILLGTFMTSKAVGFFQP